MTRKIRFLLSVIWAVGTPVARAQYLKPPDYTTSLALLKAQPLVVLLAEPDPKVLRKLADKPGELAQYRTNMALRNTLLQEYAPKLWHYSSAVVFKSEADYEGLRKASDTKTPVLHYTQGKESQTMPGPMGHRLETVSLSSEMVAHLQLDMVGSDKNDVFWNGPAPLGAVYRSDIISALRALQGAIDVRVAITDRKQDYKQMTAAQLLRGIRDRQLLRTKTLLIDRAELDEGLTEAEVKKLYPFAVQLVPLPTIEKAVEEGDVRYTYARRLTLSAEGPGPAVVDAATGEIITQSLSKKGINRADFKSFAQAATRAEQDAKMKERLEKIVRK